MGQNARNLFAEGFGFDGGMFRPYFAAAVAAFLLFFCVANEVVAQTNPAYSRLVLAPLGDPSPDAVALAAAAEEAVAACDSVVVCTGNASAGRERHDPGDNARAVGRRDACLAAVANAGGTAVAAPLNLGAGEGEHGVLLTCAPSARHGLDGDLGPPGPPGQDAVQADATPPDGVMSGDGAAAPSEEDGSGAAASEGSGEGSGEGMGESHGPRFEAGGTVLVTALGTTGGLEVGVSGSRKVSPFARAQLAIGVFPGVWVGLSTGLELHLGESVRLSAGAAVAGDGLGDGETSLVQTGGLVGMEWSPNDHLFIRGSAGPTWRWITDGEADEAEPTGPSVQPMGAASVGWRF